MYIPVDAVISTSNVLLWLGSKNIDFTCMYPREVVWPGKLSSIFNWPRHCLRSEVLRHCLGSEKMCFRWKWSNLTGEGLKLQHVETSDFFFSQIVPGWSTFSFIIIIIIIINSLTTRVTWAPQMVSQPVSSIFPCSPLPSGTWKTPGLSISRMLSSHLFLCLLSSSGFHCALRDGFCQTLWMGDMTIPLQFASLYLPYYCTKRQFGLFCVSFFRGGFYFLWSEACRPAVLVLSFPVKNLCELLGTFICWDVADF